MKKLISIPTSTLENLSIAFVSLKSNKLRSILTILIIAVGITALIGILTAIEAINGSLRSQFASMGSSTFTIENKVTQYTGSKGRRQTNRYNKISYKDAMRFKKTYSIPAYVSASVYASGSSTVKYKDYTSNPNIIVLGSDEYYLFTNGSSLLKGRFFSSNEVQTGQGVVVIGYGLAQQLFLNQSPLGKFIKIGQGKYQVIGVLEEKGSSMSSSTDKTCIIPIQNVRKYFFGDYLSYSINVRPDAKISMDKAISEASMVFRNVRQLKPKDADNFDIEKSDALIKMMMENMAYVSIAASLIGFITLLGASISLMNIMLVSVKERMREIGTRKALGATSKIIRQQFLIESVLIGEIGGALGIILGVLIGNIVARIIGSPFVVPWLWMMGGVVLCFFVGLVSGVMPAVKASKLDPIDSLRYE